eukprot:1531963-Prymnesium_polylepis.1
MRGPGGRLSALTSHPLALPPRCTERPRAAPRALAPHRAPSRSAARPQLPACRLPPMRARA